MNTKRHEDRWTSFNDKRHQNASATSCPWCDFVTLAENPLNWFQKSVILERQRVPEERY